MWFEHIFTLSATLLAIYLLYNEFSNFLIVRPTQTSLEQSPQKTEYFPLFIVCPAPAFNLTALKDEGYDSSYKLWHGNIPYTLHRNSLRMMSATFWGGKNNISQNMLMEKVVTAFDSTNWIKEGWLIYEIVRAETAWN